MHQFSKGIYRVLYATPAISLIDWARQPRLKKLGLLLMGLAHQEEIQETFDRMKEHLIANKVDIKATPLTFGPVLQMNPTEETFIGNDAANAMLTREYRKPYVVPSEIGSVVDNWTSSFTSRVRESRAVTEQDYKWHGNVFHSPRAGESSLQRGEGDCFEIGLGGIPSPAARASRPTLPKARG